MQNISYNGIWISDPLFDDRFTYAEILMYDLDIFFPIKLNTSRNRIIDNNERYYIIERIFATLSELIQENIKDLSANNDQELDINNDFLYFLLHRKDYTLEIPEVKKLFKKSILYRCVSNVYYLNSRGSVHNVDAHIFRLGA